MPFILYTGQGSQDVAGDAISGGVTDYLQKDGGTEQYELLANEIRTTVERHRAEQARQRRLKAIESAREEISIPVKPARSVGSASPDLDSRIS